RVVDNVRAEVGPAVREWVAADWVGRQHELEALRVAGRRAVAAVVHIAAAYPLRARRDADLVAGPVVADHGAGNVCTMAVNVARRGRVVAATRGRRAVMDGIVPV